MLAAAPPVLSLRGITKRFGALLANDAISIDLARGEVLALLGENGAGKSTLMNVLFGHHVADEGCIEVDGRALPPGQPRAALAAGIGMVHQHFTLAENLSVMDNVMLGTESLWRPFSRRQAARARLLQAAARFGLQVDPEARVAELSVGERQRVEILKALMRGARILILDEPTAVLTPQEAESLFATLRQMVDAGLAIVFISHKLDEVLRVSQRIAVLRNGRLVATLTAAGASKAQLAEAMVGRVVAPARRRLANGSAKPDGSAGTRASGTPICSLRGAWVRGRGARPALAAVDLEVCAGEVLVVAGVAGNGQAVLAEVLCGERALDAGTLSIAGRTLAETPRAFIKAGVARVPEDRLAVGVVGDMRLWENAVLERYREAPFARLGVVRRAAAMAHAEALVRRLDIRGTEASGVATVTRQLSGGNVQKLILGRVLFGPLDEPVDEPASGPEKKSVSAPGSAATAARTDAAPLLIVANQPTWGLDIGAVEFVHQRLLDAAAAGSAVLLISEDLDEVFALADRIAVMHQGRLSAARPAAAWSLQSIGLAMTGLLAEASPTLPPSVTSRTRDAAL